MKVAIAGAGISGLACAYELERYGIKPVILEKSHQAGEKIIDAAAMISVLGRLHCDPLEYINRKYKLSIAPLDTLREITIKCDRQEISVIGDLGYIFSRGREENSFENQIAAMIRTPITFNEQVELDYIEDRYDYVVAATGEESFAKEMGVWTLSFSSFVRVAAVLGSFRTDCIKIWLNTKYARNGYGYLIPCNSAKANLVLTVNDITYDEMDHYWMAFLEEEDLRYIITETRDYESKIGKLKNVSVGNVCFVGNSGGFIDDFFGFGMMGAVESGILAARSIAKDMDYNRLSRPLLKHAARVSKLRNILNTYDNEDYIKVLSAIGRIPERELTYKAPLFRPTAHGTVISKLQDLLKRR
ncbi:NAD(P)/FAD-dependent oxidoreductase [Pseudoclostridium thermosuccinogenes]|uniref:NAD(P)/FAD-dependent oxidoreductase n=1 Tax=Clostridium thermosuccinogenes TaxID=84032 RepID=UPI000CCBFCE3|nr:NAD(P)/FAD-dependent oxidoreductase [Pseudoclostridium thermosuccinogenes]PNT93584.1 hypothetical protein CDQ83_08830 [Pseudoclostridium thermosuccinogenes]